MSILAKFNPDDFISGGVFRLPHSIRVYVDWGAAEYKYKDTRTKLAHLYYAFKKDYNLEQEINDFLEYHREYFYELDVKRSLAFYIVLLRTGCEKKWSHRIQELMNNMDIPALLNLLKVEMRFRAVEYTTAKSNNLVIEFIDLPYDYDKIRARYGITTERNDAPRYNSYIEEITTAQETIRKRVRKGWDPTDNPF